MENYYLEDNMIGPKTIIEVVKMVNFTENADVLQFALTYGLSTVIEGQPSIKKKLTALIICLTNPEFDEKLKEQIVIDLVNKKLEFFERFSSCDPFNEDGFEAKYKELNQMLKEDGFLIKKNRLEKEGEMVLVTLVHDSKFVTECLDQCDTLIRNHSYGAAVDRAHTALHGYLKEVCDKENLIQYIKDGNPKVQDFWSVLRQHHSNFQFDKTDYLTPINQIMNSVAKVIDNINDIRNHKTFSHPNEEILENDEAKLIINFCRVILQYIDGKTVKI